MNRKREGQSQGRRHADQNQRPRGGRLDKAQPTQGKRHQGAQVSRHRHQANRKQQSNRPTAKAVPTEAPGHQQVNQHLRAPDCRRPKQHTAAARQRPHAVDARARPQDPTEHSQPQTARKRPQQPPETPPATTARGDLQQQSEDQPSQSRADEAQAEQKQPRETTTLHNVTQRQQSGHHPESHQRKEEAIKNTLYDDGREHAASMGTRVATTEAPSTHRLAQSSRQNVVRRVTKQHRRINRRRLPGHPDPAQYLPPPLGTHPQPPEIRQNGRRQVPVVRNRKDALQLTIVHRRQHQSQRARRHNDRAKSSQNRRSAHGAAQRRSARAKTGNHPAIITP